LISGRSNVFCALLVLVFFVFVPSLVAGAVVDLTIQHMNDTHGHILPFTDKSVSRDVPVSGAAYYARLIEMGRAANPDGTLLLSAGDMFQGTPVSNLFRGKPVIEIMNRLRFDAMAVGNHEFDWGRETLTAMISEAAFPFLSANITDADFNYMPRVRPYLLLTRKEIPIGIIGVTTPETKVTTKPGNVSDLLFLDPMEVVPRMIEGVKQQGARLVIVLSHLGLDADIDLADKVPGIDVIVGGHSHTAVTTPVAVGRTIIVQAGCYGVYLGTLKLKVDSETGRIVDATRENALRTVYAGPADPFDETVSRIVNSYNDKVKSEFEKGVGESRADLIRRPFDESNLGNAVCDALLEGSDAGIAFQNGGGIRADLSKGPISMEGIYTVLPFDNVLVTMDLTGKEIVEALEHSAALEHRILQVAGLKVTYDMARPVGSRVAGVFVKTGSEAGGSKGIPPAEESPQTDREGGTAAASSASAAGYERRMPEKIYRVVTNDFLAAGGDGYKTFQNGRNIVYGDNLRDAFLSYLQRHSPINPQIENRQDFLNR